MIYIKPKLFWLLVAAALIDVAVVIYMAYYIFSHNC